MWAVERNVWISAAHIPGVLNVTADEESRKFRDDIEWSLSDEWFEKICETFGTPTVDVFATRLNAKLPRFHSWKPDPKAEAIDTFSTDWGGELVYAFPPFCLIGRVLQKILNEKAEAILITPDWPTKSWFALLPNIIVGKPLMIDVVHDTLFLCSSAPHRIHPLAGKLRLRAQKVQGRLYL